MIYGISTGSAHLDALDPAVYPADPSAEIDWTELRNWLWEADATTEDAAFAGRYFLGEATEAEVDAGSGFCLWAHGEGCDLRALGAATGTPARIVPIQRADPVRHSTAGIDGRSFGVQDATALAAQLDRCLAVGDLEAGGRQILVFLEVGDGTPLSIDYWSAWATTVNDAFLSPARLADRTGAEVQQPLLPAVLCAFAFDEESQTFLPEPAVRACLDQVPESGFRGACHGLWARRLPGDPGLEEHTFSLWNNMGTYRQPRVIPGLPIPFMHRVPVRYLRWFDSPEGLPIPAGALRDTLSLITIDWPADEPDDDPLGATFTATDWRANRRAGGLLQELPGHLGVDAASVVTAAAARCLGRTDVVVKQLPYMNAHTAVDLHRPSDFAVRYYRPRDSLKDLSADECRALTLNGIQAVAVFQGTADTEHGTAIYVRGLIAPFEDEHGHADGLRAFSYAADIVGQPPFTPIYFAIDFPVDNPGYQPLGPNATPEQRADPINTPVATPPVQTILTYFQDVHSGYREYLETHPETPYHVGVYTGWEPNALAALYRAGLATHFWQTPFGGGVPFPHLNLWQIGMNYAAQVRIDNPGLRACAPGGPNPPDKIWVDLDCAWGDSGGFDVR